MRIQTVSSVDGDVNTIGDVDARLSSSKLGVVLYVINHEGSVVGHLAQHGKRHHKLSLAAQGIGDQAH